MPARDSVRHARHADYRPPFILMPYKDPAQQAAWKAAWEEAHKEERAARRVVRREEIRVRSATWLKDNKERKAATDAAWRNANPEKVAAISATWQKAHPEKTRANNSRRRTKVKVKMTREDRELSADYRIAIAHDRCFYCGASGEHDDHYISLANGGTDHWWNLVRACAPCNLRKGPKNGDEFIALLVCKRMVNPS